MSLSFSSFVWIWIDDEFVFSQSNQLAKLHLNDSNSLKEKKKKKRSDHRHHPYAKPAVKHQQVFLQRNPFLLIEFVFWIDKEDRWMEYDISQ